jgi:hypothetical protein
VYLTIGIMVALTVAAAAFLLAPRLADGRIRFEIKPDRPRAFGYKMAWLAIRTRDGAKIAEILDLAPVPCNWNSGLGTVYDDRLGENHVFVTAPVDGWTFVVGLCLPHPTSRAFVDKWTPLLVQLGSRFPEVQYFFTYPPIDFFAWARIVEGKLVRAFAIGDQGILLSRGKPTREERRLGLKLFEMRGVKGRTGDAGGELVLHPTEDHVMRLAQAWSLDPTRLDASSAEPALGAVALAPAAWRAERLRRVA